MGITWYPKTPGRVSQILKTGEPSMSRREVRDRTWDITQWVGDALRPHMKSFAGRMTFPPYSRRRSAPTTTDHTLGRN